MAHGNFLPCAPSFCSFAQMGGGYGNAQAAATPRTIPWDCSDWQAAAAVADAEDARVSVILESLATNRGKTLYCGVDQSDTFTKSETWQAGKDRNERDDTVYYGENGRFRGFLAAQEGYLTDGESGVTGISRDRVFEFPVEERRRRRWRTQTYALCPEYDTTPQGRALLREHPYPVCVIQTGTATPGAANANRQIALQNALNQWSVGTAASRTARPIPVNSDAKFTSWRLVANRQDEADSLAQNLCQAGGGRLRGAAAIYETSTQGQAVTGIYYSQNQSQTEYQFGVGRQIFFRATCQKRVRR